MFEESSWKNDETWTEKEIDVRTINDVDITDWEAIPGFRFLFGMLVGSFFFFAPINWGGEITIPFALVYGFILDNYPLYARWFAFVLAVYGFVLTAVSMLYSRDILSLTEKTAQKINWEYWDTNLTFGIIRGIGLLFLAILAFELGPPSIHVDLTRQLWIDLIPIIGVVVPLGALLVNLLIRLGGIDFVGTLARPFMIPVFKLPGRSALDALASALGSAMVGYYLTYNVFRKGGYNKREVYILMTCFVTGSLGTLALVSELVGVIYLFPVIVVSWFVALITTGLVLVRLPPLTRVPNEYIKQPDMEYRFAGSARDYFRFAVSNAIQKAGENSISGTLYSGGIDGLKVAAVMTGVIVAFAYPLFLILGATEFFQTLSSPLVPVIDLLGIPDAEIVSLGVLAGVILDLLPAVLAGGAGVKPMAGFFIVVLSMSQILHLSTSIPVGMDLFRDVPLRFRDLILLFVLRTLILIPVIAVLAHIINFLGLF